MHFIEDYFPLLKYKIVTTENLNIYQTVDEGIDKLLKKVIKSCSSYNELITKIKSKRYTYNKISRMLLHILIGFTKTDAKTDDNLYIRILGYNAKGQKYLNKIKKETQIPIISKFKKDNKLLNLELKSTIIYSIPKNENLTEKELKNNLKKETNYND